MSTIRQEVMSQGLTGPHPANGSRSRYLILKCGHELLRKPSIAVPKVVRCRECEQKDGGPKDGDEDQ